MIKNENLESLVFHLQLKYSILCPILSI